jgi:predicted CopG family antitoxin
MHECMKTITLDEVAYARLKAWKRSSKESFSSVVKRVLPEPGTLGTFLNFVDSKDTAHLPGNEILESAVIEKSEAKHDPWTS